MSKGDITRLNHMYKCSKTNTETLKQMTSPQNKQISGIPAEQQKQISVISFNPNIMNIANRPGQFTRPSKISINPYNKNKNIENQPGQHTRPNERLYEQKQFIENQPSQYPMPPMYQSVKNILTPANPPVQEQKPSQNLVKITQPSEFQNATTEKPDKPCGSKIFMTFLIKISQK